jgi:DNA-binding MarR family transcriptional regulator
LLLLAVGDGPLDFGTMAADLLLSKPSTNRNIDTLIELRLAARARNSGDRRKVFISITDAGRTLLGSMGVS